MRKQSLSSQILGGSQSQRLLLICPFPFCSSIYQMTNFNFQQYLVFAVETNLVCPKLLKYWDTKTVNFPFVPNGKLVVFRCPNNKHKHIRVNGRMCAPYTCINFYLILYFLQCFYTIINSNKKKSFLISVLITDNSRCQIRVFFFKK